ncbi:hypothetical protein KXD40_002877 [Peronospora effusa]|nr:hypothetical protein KXD40_002877 [Peronospora effusa]
MKSVGGSGTIGHFLSLGLKSAGDNVKYIKGVDKITSGIDVNAIDILSVGAGQIRLGTGKIEIVAIGNGVDFKNERLLGAFSKRF